MIFHAFLKAKEMIIFGRTNSVNWEMTILENIRRMLVVNWLNWSFWKLRVVGIWDATAHGASRPPFPFVFGLHRCHQAAMSCKRSLKSDRRKQGILLHALGLFSHYPGSWLRAVLHHCLDARKGWAGNALIIFLKCYSHV